MRTTRIYCHDIQLNQQPLALNATSSSHLCKVLRLNSGDTLILFDGKGNSFSAIIETASPKKTVVKISNALTENTESNLTLHLGLGMSKGDRMDYAIQKSVEVGVTHITPLLTKFSVIKLDEQRRQKKLEHWLGIIINACEQSGRTILPVLNPITPLSSWLEHEAGHKIVFDPEANKSLVNLTPTDSVSLLIGPEGGLCKTEIDMAASEDFQAIKLGPRTLRTETAAVVACATIQTIWGDYSR